MPGFLQKLIGSGTPAIRNPNRDLEQPLAHVTLVSRCTGQVNLLTDLDAQQPGYARALEAVHQAVRQLTGRDFTKALPRENRIFLGATGVGALQDKLVGTLTAAAGLQPGQPPRLSSRQQALLGCIRPDILHQELASMEHRFGVVDFQNHCITPHVLNKGESSCTAYLAVDPRISGFGPHAGEELGFLLNQLLSQRHTGAFAGWEPRGPEAADPLPSRHAGAIRVTVLGLKAQADLPQVLRQLAQDSRTLSR